jgi:hypothetical protein
MLFAYPDLADGWHLTHNCDLAAEIVLDFSCFDGIGGILCDDLVQIWILSGKRMLGV